MRLLFLEWTLSSKLGGMELSMLDQCLQLRERGHQVWIGYHQTGDLLPRYVAGGVRPLRLARYGPLRRRLVRDVLGLLGNLVRTLPITLDVVAANSYQSTFFGAVLARAKRIPLACHLRLNPPDVLTIPTRLALTQVSRFIAVSQSVKALWSKRGVDSDAIDLVYNGIDLTRFRPLDARARIRGELGLEANDFVICTAGRIDPPKNVEGLLRTFAAVRRGESRARLLIAGMPVNHESAAAGKAYVESLQSQAQALGIADDVRWLGHRADMPEVYNASDAALLLGLVPEPFGRVTCEALACGIPMVTPRQGGSVEILTGEFARFLFDPTQPEEAARLLLSLVDWQRRDPGLADRARGHIRDRFDLQMLGPRLEAAYASIVQQGPVRRGPATNSFRGADPGRA